MAQRLDLGWPNPERLQHLECAKAIAEPASKYHQGQRLAPQQKSGCTGAIYPFKPSSIESLDKWGRPCTDARDGQQWVQERTKALNQGSPAPDRRHPATTARSARRMGFPKAVVRPAEFRSAAIASARESLEESGDGHPGFSR